MTPEQHLEAYFASWNTRGMALWSGRETDRREHWPSEINSVFEAELSRRAEAAKPKPVEPPKLTPEQFRRGIEFLYDPANDNKTVADLRGALREAEGEPPE